jgi:CheY-like chemotaxis protein
MKLLLVEDDPNKRDAISSWLKSAFPTASMTVEVALQPATRRIRDERFDCIVLDMAIPNFDPALDRIGGQTRVFGGRDLLRQMKRLHVVVPTVVLTQFETFVRGSETIRRDDLDRELSADHPECYLGMVYYSAAVHGWKDRLMTLMRGLSDES